MTNAWPSISVVVPTYNRAVTLRQCLAALAVQDYAGPWQAIVIDDGSTDETPDVLRSFPDFVYLRQANRGPAAARNRGIQEARGEIVAFTDDDCLAPPDWLSRLADGYLRYPHVTGAQEVEGGFDCPAGGANNLSYRRDRLLEVGGFDESFPFAAGEDADLKLRICQRGARLLYAPVCVLHLREYT
jgi:glycosyltransferase involved in cell wall biosynthesis